MHHKLLKAYHSWAYTWAHFVVDDGFRPLRELMSIRKSESWNDTQDVMGTYDSANSEGWTRQCPGVGCQLENLMNEFLGEGWGDILLAAGAASWGQRSGEFVRFVCGKYGFPWWDMHCELTAAKVVS